MNCITVDYFLETTHLLRPGVSGAPTSTFGSCIDGGKSAAPLPTPGVSGGVDSWGGGGMGSKCPISAKYVVGVNMFWISSAGKGQQREGNITLSHNSVKAIPDIFYLPQILLTDFTKAGEHDLVECKIKDVVSLASKNERAKNSMVRIMVGVKVNRKRNANTPVKNSHNVNARARAENLSRNVLSYQVLVQSIFSLWISSHKSTQ